MPPKFVVIVLAQTGEDPPAVTPMEILVHARAQHYKTIYVTVMTVVITQIVMTTLLLTFGLQAKPILLGVLGGALGMAGLASWVSTRKGIIE